MGVVVVCLSRNVRDRQKGRIVSPGLPGLWLRHAGGCAAGLGACFSFCGGGACSVRRCWFACPAPRCRSESRERGRQLAGKFLHRAGSLPPRPPSFSPSRTRGAGCLRLCCCWRACVHPSREEAGACWGGEKRSNRSPKNIAACFVGLFLFDLPPFPCR